MENRVRWATYIPEPFSEELEALTKEFGLTKGQFILMLVKLGHQAFLRGYKPETLLSADQWATIAAKAVEKGSSDAGSQDSK